MKSFLKIAHRGYSENFPENTLLAFRKALEFGADMIELDVHLSRDGYLVVIHDDEVDRTSDGKGMVKDLTLRELRELNFNFTGCPESVHEPIPLLEDVLDLVKGRALLNIELKTCPVKYPDIEQAVADLVRRADYGGSVIVSAFDHYALLRMRQICPSIKRGMLYDSIWTTFRQEVEALEVYSVHPSVATAFPEHLIWASERGCKIYPWVARDRKTIEDLKKNLPIDGIMVNNLLLF